MDLRILQAIRNRGIRQRDLARILGISETVVSRIVTGVYNLDEVMKARIARALKCKTADLFSSKELRLVTVEELENMRCCGNCGNLECCEGANNCCLGHEEYSPDGYCKDWIFDHITRKQRKGQD